ncbi:uncharacterized protein LOC141630503 [Silene latifolia]|uniref:uncharacterized protein LOC141630503 n=1 Tax=Silene latifolia TaxID=37657 RepID=UPI003D76DD7C
MVNIGFWNVRGINKWNKQGDIRRFLHINKIGLFGLVETRVKIKNKARIQDGFGRPWQIIDNSEIKDSGRIWLLWDSSQILVQCIKKELQVIHAQVTNLVTGFGWTCSLVYRCNADSDRAALWDSLIDMKISTGAYFTWNNKQKGDARVFSRIDRVLANDEWILTGPTGSVTFLPEGLYDHSPCLIELGANIERRKGNFKYFNMWGKHAEFKNIVNDVWRQPISGCCMFQLVKKLKDLKHPLKKLNNGRYGDIENTALVAKIMLESIQNQLHNDPRNVQLQNEERIVADSYKELDDDRLLFLAQKAKTQWVNFADDNTRAVVKTGRVVSSEHVRGMVKQVTDAEIREALFSIPVEKALVRTKEFLVLVDSFMTVNATVLTLIPKMDCPSSVHDFRPIACCNVIYKCISKIICSRLSGVLMDIVSMNQSAFIKDREIVDNILICQDLVRLYGRKTCTPRAMLKIDLKKAYDSIEWAFLRDMLIVLEFPER